MSIKIIDSTLREGRQSIYFDAILHMQEAYLDLISQMGINDIEYRNPYINQEELDTYHELYRKFPHINFHVHLFPNKKNIERALADSTVDRISTFIKFPITKESLLSLIHSLHGTSKKVRVGIEDAPILPLEDLNEYLKLLENEAAIDRVAFSDTLGRFSPDEVGTFMKNLNSIELTKDIEFHLHNDYGLAAANALKILSETNATDRTTYFSASMFGVGERNGILSYGDLISNMIRLNVPHSLHLETYGELVTLMELNKISFNRDPISATSFLHFASSHIIAGTRGENYHTIPPEILGMKNRLAFNKLTGQDVFKHISEALLHHVVSDDGLLAKNYVIKKMEGLHKSVLSFEEVTSFLDEFYTGTHLSH